ncbi:TonB-dependent receptor [Luteimonas sp. RIT-PG2_3]
MAASVPAIATCQAADVTQQPADRVIDVDIPSQALTSGVLALSRQAGIQVLMPTLSVDHLRTLGAKGQMPLQQALSRLLAGTGLSFRVVDARTVTIFLATASGEGGGLGKSPDAQDRLDRPGEAADMGRVMVTATRRETSLAEVPYNLQVISGSKLEDIGAKSAADFVRTIPGMSAVDYGKRGGISMVLRGLRNGGEGGAGMDRRTTSVYIDDIEIPSTLNPAIVDIDHIEVLRGPQGTLYGSGAIGGTLRYITVAPSLDAVEGRVSAEIGRTRHGGLNHEVAAMVNLPLATDVAAMRLNVSRSDNSGFIENVRLGEDGINWDRNLSARLGLLVKPGERFDVALTYYMDRSDFGVGSNIAEDIGPYANSYYSSGRSTRDTDLFGLVANQRFEHFTLTSSTSYKKYRSTGNDDITYDIRDLIFASFLAPEELPEFTAYSDDLWTDERWTQEVRLVSSGDSRWNWLAGAYWTSSTLAERRNEFVPIPFPGQAAFEENVIGAAINDEREYYFQSDTKYRQVAAFGELGYQITPRWNASVGGRWFEYRASNIFYAIDQYFGRNARDAQGLGRTTPYANEFTYGNANQSGSTFRFNTSFNLTPDHLLYATVAEGFRPGGYNNVSPNTGVEPEYRQYAPDSIRSYEVGAKGGLLDGKAYYSTSVYYVDWQEMQTTGSTPLGYSLIMNAGSASSRGVELEVGMRDLWTRGLDVGLTYAHTDMSLSEPIANLGRAGDHAPYVPRNNASLNTGYRFDVGSSLRASVNLLATYTGEVATSFGDIEPDDDGVLAPNPYYLRLDDYLLFGLNAQLSGMGWSVRLGGSNLFDKLADVRRSRAIVESPYRASFYSRTVNRPRTVTLGFIYNF